MRGGRIKPLDPPPPTYNFAYHEQPQSGNEINGLNETSQRQARHVFHSAGSSRLEWQALDDFFGMVSPWTILKHVAGNAWQLRNKDGRVNKKQRTVEDSAAMSMEIKERATRLGAELVGITRVTEEALFEGMTVPFNTAICIGLTMDREQMAHVPHEPAGVEVMRVYRAISGIAVKLSGQIRKMGWPARAYGNPNSMDILHVPLAINAGLGQLGKHGSIISKEFGSNFRLAAVLTNLPLDIDEPKDIGVDDLCMGCQRCVIDCPPGAISNEKQMVRGKEKWYVNFDKCVPYFVKTDGCAICIQVCPWSVPGRGPSLSEKLLAKRAAK
jgi:NAD-dependent dihydropyrimidine dehydrogenase PreA subunit